MFTRRVGLTGGIGSGKSTVAGLLAGLGAAVVDSDAIARQLTAIGGSAIPPIQKQFGSAYISAVGALDREAMRALVFSDPAAKLALEAILHPRVAAETARQAAAAEAAGRKCIVFDVPLLVESGRWRQQVHDVLVVDCTEATQVARVLQRSGWTREAVLRTVAAQATREERLAAADICIYNETSSLEQLGALVRQAGMRFGL